VIQTPCTESGIHASGLSPGVFFCVGRRSLFTAMTFLAVVLGMIPWLDRAWIGK
jgi:hypothetical protein